VFGKRFDELWKFDIVTLCGLRQVIPEGGPLERSPRLAVLPTWGVEPSMMDESHHPARRFTVHAAQLLQRSAEHLLGDLDAVDGRAQQLGVVGHDEAPALKNTWVEELLRRADARSDLIDLGPIGTGCPHRAARLLAGTAREAFHVMARFTQRAHNVEPLAVPLAAAFDDCVAKLRCHFTRQAGRPHDDARGGLVPTKRFADSPRLSRAGRRANLVGATAVTLHLLDEVVDRPLRQAPCFAKRTSLGHVPRRAGRARPTPLADLSGHEGGHPDAQSLARQQQVVDSFRSGHVLAFPGGAVDGEPCVMQGREPPLSRPSCVRGLLLVERNDGATRLQAFDRFHVLGHERLAGDSANPQIGKVARDVGFRGAFGEIEIGAGMAVAGDVIDVREPRSERSGVLAGEQLRLQAGDPAVFIPVRNDVALVTWVRGPETQPAVLVGEARTAPERCFAEARDERCQQALVLSAAARQ
jgi:hypothetical protein